MAQEDEEELEEDVEEEFRRLYTLFRKRICTHASVVKTTTTADSSRRSSTDIDA